MHIANPALNHVAALLSILLALTGCSTGPVNFDRRESASDTAAIVYIYRPDTLANVMISPDVMVDGKLLFAINHKQFHTVQLPAGQHRIQLQLTERYLGNHEILLDTLNGQTIYLRVDTAVKFQQNRPYDRSFEIKAVTEAEALEQLARCKPAVIKNPEPVAEPGATTPTYSNQTFRNPFSK